MNARAYDNVRRPWEWDCNDPRWGCYVTKCVPRFELLNVALTGLRSFSDVDGSTECNGYYLALEFKMHRKALNTGQLLYMTRQPPEYTTLVVICPDCTTMQVQEMALVNGGELGPFIPADLADLRRFISRWEALRLSWPAAYKHQRVLP